MESNFLFLFNLVIHKIWNMLSIVYCVRKIAVMVSMENNLC